jgi:hypothetical protein
MKCKRAATARAVSLLGASRTPLRAAEAAHYACRADLHSAAVLPGRNARQTTAVLADIGDRYRMSRRSVWSILATDSTFWQVHRLWHRLQQGARLLVNVAGWPARSSL